MTDNDSVPPASGVEEAEGEWRKPTRPAYHPEEGDADRSDWASLLKATCLILLPIAVVAFFLTR